MADDVTHRPLGRTRLQPAGDRRRRRRRSRAARVRGRRAHRGDHAQRPTRQCDHDRDGRAADGGARDDRRAHRGARRDHHGRRRARVLRRQRPAPAEEHDEGAVAPPAAGLRPHALHTAAASQADLRRRQRRCLRRGLGGRAEHRFHHRLRERDVRAARIDDRPRRRRRLARLPPARPAARQGPADAASPARRSTPRRHTGSAWSTRSIRRPS